MLTCACMRLQRFAQMPYFKRSVLEHVAADLLSLHTAEQPQLTRLGSFLRLSRAATPDASVHRSAASRSLS